MATVETKGKTVDEAIFNGLNKLGVGIDEVEIEILHEGSKGLFGLGKSAVVRLTQKSPAMPDLRAVMEMERESEPEEPPKWAERTRDAEPRKRRTRGKSGAGRVRESAPEPAALPQEEDEPKEARAAEAAAAVTFTDERGEAEEFLDGLFEVMQVHARARRQSDSDDLHIRITIEGDDTSPLIGRRGETLDALQYLTGLVVNRDKNEYVRVMLDAEGYRSKRERTLQNLAQRLAGNVIRSGRPVRLEPMNPYERRILHSALQNNPKVETYSEGTDPYRRVIIRRKRRDSGGSGRPPKGRSQHND